MKDPTIIAISVIAALRPDEVAEQEGDSSGIEPKKRH